MIQAGRTRIGTKLRPWAKAASFWRPRTDSRAQQGGDDPLEWYAATPVTADGMPRPGRHSPARGRQPFEFRRIELVR